MLPLVSVTPALAYENVAEATPTTMVESTDGPSWDHIPSLWDHFVSGGPGTSTNSGVSDGT